MLFPRLRPGGLYVIEDWSGSLRMHDGVEKLLARLSEDQRARLAEHAASSDRPSSDPPLAVLMIELMLASALRPDVVRHLTIERGIATVERGGASLESGFRIGDLYHDHFGLVVG